MDHEELKDSTCILESTLSSELVTFPSGQKLDDISTVTEISDSGSDAEKLYSNSRPSVSLPNDLSDKMINNIEEYLIPTSKEIKLNLSSSVRDTLHNKANLLVDKNILNDLLHPCNANYTNNLMTVQKKFSETITGVQFSENEDLGSKSKDVEEMQNYNLKPALHNSLRENDATSRAYLSVSSTPKKVKPITFTSLEASGRNGVGAKHVNFVSSNSEIALKKNKENEAGSRMQPDLQEFNKYASQLNSFISYGPEIVYEKLGAIRNHLEVNGKEREDETDTSELPLSRLLIAKLNSQKQRTKDLEEELTLNEASLAKTTCELEIVQKRLMRREEQLKDAGEEIGKLQGEWQSIQQRLLTSRDKYQSENERLKKVVEASKLEKESDEKELKELREKAKQLEELRALSEGLKSQVENSCQQNDEIIEENKRLIADLKGAQEKVTYYEKDYIPPLVSSENSLREEVSSLHSKLDSLVEGRASLQQENSLLKERHSLLLRKALDEAQMRQEAGKEKDMALDLVSRLRTDEKRFSLEMREHYQGQMEAILREKVGQVKASFACQEKSLEERFLSQMKDLRESLERERREADRRNKEEFDQLKKKERNEMEEKNEELRGLRRENEELRAHRDAIVRAVAAAVPPKWGAPTGGGQVNLAPCEPQKAISSSRPHHQPQQQQQPSSYHLTHLGGMEPYLGAPPEGRGRGPPSRKEGRTELGVAPLITSTSLSSLLDESDGSTEGRGTVRERREWRERKEERSGKGHKGSDHYPLPLGGRPPSRPPLGGSQRSISKEEVLKRMDKEVESLVQEITSISEIMAPPSIRPPAPSPPHHDTSSSLQDHVRRTQEQRQRQRQRGRRAC